LWNYTSENLIALDSGDLGPNLLRVFFDPQFGFRELMGSETQWHRTMRRNIQSFRQVSFPYVITNRYRHILRIMQQRYRDFSILWDLSERNEQTLPFTTIHHSEFGSISVMSLRVSPRFLGQDVFISAYIPLRPDDTHYDRLYASVAQNRVFFFKEQVP
jgi:hypothetical protein